MTRRFKIETLANERVPEIGEYYHGALVVAAFPPNPNIIVEVDDTAILALNVVDLRPEHTDYGIVEVATAPHAPAVGDTYPPETIRARGRFGAGVALGIVDTGLDRGHIAFDGCDVDTDIADQHGHGSHVASTAASTWGIASKATIIARAGIPGGNGTETSVANAIRAVVDAGAQIVSLSLGGSISSVIDAGCQYARSRGAIVVAAAGNTPGAAIGSPARAADAIVISCTRAREYNTWTSGPEWSNPNRVSDYGDQIWAAQAGTRDVARAMSGTSMAAPHVSGKLALLLGAGLSRDEALLYLWTHRSSPPSVGVSILTEDFGEGSPDVDGETQQLLTSLRNTANAIRGNLDYGRFVLRGADPDAAWTHVGEGSRLLADDFEPVLAALEDHLGKAPTPEEPAPPPASEAWTGLLSHAAGIVGQTKWLAGSTGIDLFVPRETVVQAPLAGTVTFRQVPGGPIPIGEMVITHVNGRTVRFRHVAPIGQSGPCTLSQPVARVFDPSMDTLRWPAGYPAPPDGYQHLDLSLASHPSRLNPQGGAGGDVNAWAHVFGTMGGVANMTVISRTPGPPEGAMTTAVRTLWKAWAAPQEP